MMAWWTEDYPNRYYVSTGPTENGIAPIIGCYDMAIFSEKPDGLPSVSSLTAVTGAAIKIAPVG